MRAIAAIFTCMCVCSCAVHTPAPGTAEQVATDHTNALAVADAVVMDLLAEVNLSGLVEGLGAPLSVIDYDREIAAEPGSPIISVHYALRGHPGWIGHPRSFSVVVHTGTFETRFFKLSEAEPEPVYERFAANGKQADRSDEPGLDRGVRRDEE